MRHRELRPFRVAYARDLGAQFRDNPVRMIGQDGAYSIPLDDDPSSSSGSPLAGPRGETLWFFGDSYIGPPEAAGPRHIDRIRGAERVITNTGLITAQRDASRGITEFRYLTDEQGELRPLIPPLPEERPETMRTWCQHGCCIGETLYLYFVQVRMLEHGPWLVNFEVMGSGLAVGSRRDFVFRRVERSGSCLLWSARQPHFGGGVLCRREDDHAYVYGCLREEDEVQRCYLARAGKADARDGGRDSTHGISRDVRRAAAGGTGDGVGSDCAARPGGRSGADAGRDVEPLGRPEPAMGAARFHRAGGRPAGAVECALRVKIPIGAGAAAAGARAALGRPRAHRHGADDDHDERRARPTD